MKIQLKTCLGAGSIAAIALCLLGGCGPRIVIDTYACEAKLSEGMTKKEVETACGKPSYEVETGDMSSFGYYHTDQSKLLSVFFRKGKVTAIKLEDTER